MAFTSDERDAFKMFMSILEQIGFHNNGQIAQAVRGMVIDGMTDINEIELGLRDTKAWKQRFAGNEIRVHNGLDALSVDEYLATEKAYSQIMHQAGLPAGFYDDPADFAKMIGGDMSPDELNSRLQVAVDIKNREDPALITELAKRGMSQGDITAWVIDPKRALPLIQKKYESALIGAAAERAGVDATVAYANKLAGEGITEQQAVAGFGEVAQIAQPLSHLADIYGEKYGTSDAEAEVFDNNAEAARKREQLTSQEKAAFGGSSGTGQGSLTKNPAGSY